MENQKVYKFVSRQQKYQIVLQPGLEGNRFTGERPKPGIYLMFRGGEVEIRRPINGVQPKELYEMAKLHPAFGGDFVDATDGADNPFGDGRNLSESQHNILEMKHGSVSKNVNPEPTVKFSSEQKKVMKGMFVKLLEEMPADSLKKILAEKEEVPVKVAEEVKTTDKESEKDETTDKEDKKDETKIKGKEGLEDPEPLLSDPNTL